MTPRRSLAAVALACTVTFVAGGCAGGRNTLNTRASACFRAIGVAADAAGKHGRLLGVDEMSASRERRLYPDDRPRGRRVCVVGFGETDRRSVIVVAVEVHKQRVIGVHRSQRSPVRFRHLR